jgi:hypothetical protein
MELAGEAWVEGRDLRRSIGEIQALYALRHGALNGSSADNGTSALNATSVDNVAAQG